MNTLRNFFSRKFRTAFVLSVLAASFLVAVSFHSTAQSTSSQQPAQQPASPQRKFTTKTFKDCPVAIHQVRNLNKEKDWFRDLEIEVKNVSDKPIYFISLGLEFPDIHQVHGDGEDKNMQARLKTGFPLKFGRPELMDVRVLAVPEDIPINPGETYVFTIPDTRVKGLEYMRKSMDFPPEATDNILIRFDTFSFGDGTGFVGGGFGGKRDYRDKTPKKQPSDNQVFQKINWNKSVCESVVEISHEKSTTYEHHFNCGYKSDGVSPLFSTPIFFNY